MDYRWNPSPKERTQGPNQIPSAVVFSQKRPIQAILGIFSTGTYAGIGTMFVSSLKMLYKVHRKKKKKLFVEMGFF